MCVGTAPGGDMLIYAQGMYIMHVPFNPSDENPGSMTLYIPGLTLLLALILKNISFLRHCLYYRCL